ncbi:hypothetical protein PCANC_16246 [Puccinia coronata f. sp. avenae]|uniref:Secreted protein n=1 Tax=Puccinia coronata f. sp. avenae TaxID=200324 RepID=A0A2N5SVD0_9BASI|nr:hypothetical protein PCANC_16246 [Puccinia coronata f. sp. avenae]
MNLIKFLILLLYNTVVIKSVASKGGQPFTQAITSPSPVTSAHPSACINNPYVGTYQISHSIVLLHHMMLRFFHPT